jgi:hypothetical protein
MLKPLTLLLASTAVTAAIGLPAWSVMRVHEGESPLPSAALLDEGAEALPLILASEDDDDRRIRERSRRGHDDDDHDDDDENDDDEEDDDKDDDGAGARSPAPAGTVAPPQNGLFGTGAPPQVKVN